MSSGLSIQSENFGDGKPLVLLHAFPLNRELWRNYLFPGFKTITPDFPGFGSSKQGPEDLTIEQAALGLKEHLDQTGVKEPIILGGISMGGYWAMEFARQFPDCVVRLALISTRSTLDTQERKDKRLEVAARVLKEGMEWYVPSMLETLLGETTRKTQLRLVEWVSKTIREANPKAVAAAQKAMANRRDQTEFMHQCPAPSQWYLGMEDTTLTFQEIKSMSQNSKNSGFITFAKSGHLIPVEMFKQFAMALYQFIK